MTAFADHIPGAGAPRAAGLASLPARGVRALGLLLFLLALACSDTKDSSDPVEPAKPVASVALTPDSIELAAGETRALSVILKAADSTVLDARPITWTSGNPGVAVVDAAGRVTAVAAGIATISAQSEGRMARARVRVPRPPPVVAFVDVSPREVALQPGQARHLDIAVRDADSTVIDLPPTAAIGFTSSNEMIATVSGDGTVLARQAGAATITVTVDGKSAEALVMVVGSALEFTLSRGAAGNLPLTIRSIVQPTEDPELRVLHVLRLTGGRLRLGADRRTYEQQLTIETWEVVTYRGTSIATLRKAETIDEDGTMGATSGVGSYFFLPDQPGFGFTGWHSDNDGFTLARRVADSANEFTLIFAPTIRAEHGR